jgi:Ethanolamine utilization protein EutJ (predicted chaperonin)
MDEIVWDYQVVGGTDGVELDAVLLAVKQDNVRAMTDAITAIGLEPTVIDAAPTALYNAAKYCGAGQDGCTMVLDIGFRSTGLVFVEGDKVFTRNIPVAGLHISQEIQKNANCTFQEAESFKLRSGFVALGGTYAVTDDERADRLSKVIRTIVTRLHAEVMRSINFYRSQQGGSAPNRLLLTGMSSLLPYMDQFFADKLQIEVSYFNPFETVQVAPTAGLDLESANQIVQFGNVVGLALRHSDAAVLQMNLLPPAIVARKAFRRRVPFFALSAVAMLAGSFLWNRYAAHTKTGYEGQLDYIAQKVSAIRGEQGRLDTLSGKLDTFQEKAALLRAMADGRSSYVRCLEAIRKGLPNGAWLRSMRQGPANALGGITSLRIDGYAFEDDLRAGFGDGTKALFAFVSGLVRTNPTLFRDAERATGTLRNNFLRDNDQIREFSFEIQLVHPLGIPYSTDVATDTQDGEEEEE